jgi:hypothetical protein
MKIPCGGVEKIKQRLAHGDGEKNGPVFRPELGIRKLMAIADEINQHRENRDANPASGRLNRSGF